MPPNWRHQRFSATETLTTSSQVRTTQKGGSTFGELTPGFFQLEIFFKGYKVRISTILIFLKKIRVSILLAMLQ